MDSISQREPRILWSFWISCGLAATGGIAPLLLAAGSTNRIAGAAIPFGIAAAAMAVNALTYQRGRPLATSLYFLAGIALVYGMLSMVAVPLRLAVIGTCPAPPAACPVGFERPFTSGEGAGFAFGIAMGTLAILVGFFGLLMQFRIRPQQATPPPVRRDEAVVATAAASVEKPKAEAEPATPPAPESVATHAIPTEPEQAANAAAPDPAPPAPASSPQRAPKPRVKRVSKPQAELPPPAEPLELPAASSPDEPNPEESSST